MFAAFFAAKTLSFSYAPGASLRSARARSRSSFCEASSSGEEAVRSGADVAGLHSAQGEACGLRGFLLCRGACAAASNGVAASSAKIHSQASTAVSWRPGAERRGFQAKRTANGKSEMPSWGRVRILAESFRIAVGKDLHHPVIKIIHRMGHDGAEATVVFPVSFFNFIPQSITEISVFAAPAHLFRTKHFNVLHGNFGHSICAAVQFLLLRREAVEVEGPGNVWPRGQWLVGWVFGEGKRGMSPPRPNGHGGGGWGGGGARGAGRRAPWGG